MASMSIKYDLLPDGYEAHGKGNSWLVFYYGKKIATKRGRDAAIKAAWVDASRRLGKLISSPADPAWGELGKPETHIKHWRAQKRRAKTARGKRGHTLSADTTRLFNSLRAALK
jgi:hypothetical protein